MPDDLTPDMRAAVMVARGNMFRALEAEFPGEGMRLYLVACSGGVTDALNSDIAPGYAHVIEGALRGTRYSLTERRAN